MIGAYSEDLLDFTQHTGSKSVKTAANIHHKGILVEIGYIQSRMLSPVMTNKPNASGKPPKS